MSVHPDAFGIYVSGVDFQFRNFVKRSSISRLRYRGRKLDLFDVQLKSDSVIYKELGLVDHLQEYACPQPVHIVIAARILPRNWIGIHHLSEVPTSH